MATFFLLNRAEQPVVGHLFREWIRLGHYSVRQVVDRACGQVSAGSGEALDPVCGYRHDASLECSNAAVPADPDFAPCSVPVTLTFLEMRYDDAGSLPALGFHSSIGFAVDIQINDEFLHPKRAVTSSRPLINHHTRVHPF